MCIGVCLHVFLCTNVAFSVQKIPLGLELPMAVSHHVGVGGLNSGPVEEQPVLLTTEPSLMPRQYSLFKPSPVGGWLRTPLIPALRRQRQADLCEFEASLVYKS